MANHSYLTFDRVFTPAEAETLLTSVVRGLWGDRVLVTRTTEAGREWIVSFPGTALPKEVAGKSLMAPEEDFGFCVWLRSSMFEFRHPYNNWEWWAQNKVEHQLAFELSRSCKVVRTDDGTGEKPLDIDPASCRATYREYIRRNYSDREISADVDDFHKRLLANAPEGFRD